MNTEEYMGNKGMNTPMVAPKTSVLNDVNKLHSTVDQVSDHITAEIDQISKFIDAGNQELGEVSEHRDRLVESLRLAEEKQSNLIRAKAAVLGDDRPSPGLGIAVDSRGMRSGTGAARDY